MFEWTQIHFFYRRFHCRSRRLCLRSLLSLVRLILEYAVPVWCPYLVKDIRALESIQRRASRLALKQHKGETPFDDRSKLLKWLSLSDRRNYLSLTECYEFVFGYYHLNFYDFFEFSKVGSTRANHPYASAVGRLPLKLYVSKWNDLPRDIVEAESLLASSF